MLTPVSSLVCNFFWLGLMANLLPDATEKWELPGCCLLTPVQHTTPPVEVCSSECLRAWSDCTLILSEAAVVNLDAHSSQKRFICDFERQSDTARENHELADFPCPGSLPFDCR